MESDADMAARHAGLLAGLSERAYALACELQEQALAAEEPAQKVAFARAFHDVSRSVRQSLALELRLRRETRRLAEEAEAAEQPRRQAREARRAQARASLQRFVWNEYEPIDDLNTDALIDDLIEEAAAAGPAFADEPAERLIARLEARLCAVLDGPGKQGAEPDPSPAAHPGDGRDPGGAGEDPPQPAWLLGHPAPPPAPAVHSSA